MLDELGIDRSRDYSLRVDSDGSLLIGFRGKASMKKREVGYLREEIQVSAPAVPEFKPTWQDMRGRDEAS